jgi:heme-degrading monooxygenase HmoA
MTVAYTYNSVSREEYEALFPQVLGEDRPHEGLIMHAAGEETGGKWHIVEVWDSDENRSRWERETLLPALQQHGVDTSQGPPEWTRVEVRNLVTR